MRLLGALVHDGNTVPMSAYQHPIASRRSCSVLRGCSSLAWTHRDSMYTLAFVDTLVWAFCNYNVYNILVYNLFHKCPSQLSTNCNINCVWGWGFCISIAPLYSQHISACGNFFANILRLVVPCRHHLCSCVSAGTYLEIGCNCNSI